MAVTSDNNSCLMTAKWDWSTNSTSNKHSTQQEIFKMNSVYFNNAGSEDAYPFEVIEVKTKVRGHGKAVKIRFESSEGKDFEILGWAMDITAEAQS